jgi:sec-independent protein translocase protein TatB
VFNLSGSEIVVILLLALVVLGPEKLPDALKRAGRTYAELKKMGNSFQEEVKSALDEPMKEMRETADLLRKAADFTDEPATPAAPPGSGNRATPAPAAAPAATPVPVALDTDSTPASPAGIEPPPQVEVIPPEELDHDLVNSTLSGGAPLVTVMPDTAIGSVTVSPDDPDDDGRPSSVVADEPSTT